jgi:hypothetical protein
VYIRKTAKTYKGRTYTNSLLVESVHTPKGPRQRILCSLGSLAPAPPQQWLELAHRIEASLEGQTSLAPADANPEAVVEKARRGRKRAARESKPEPPADSRVTIDPERVRVEEAREAGPVHAGHQMWQQLGLTGILQATGLPDRACRLSEAMTLNRLACPLSEHAMPDWMRRTALGDILDIDFAALNDDALYRNLDRLHPKRERIEAALALRMSAQGLHHSQTFLGEYYRRMRARLGAPKAITAAAHKLARIVYHLLTTRQPYDESIFIEQELRFRKRKEARLRAQARELAFWAGAGRGYSLSLVP